MIYRLRKTLTALALVFAVGLAGTAMAAVPDGIDYQGYLTNSDGSAVNGDVSMVFVAYNVDIGGAPLWSKPATVPVENGLFSVTLGSPVNPFPLALFDGPVYIALVIDDEELLPRRVINSTGYAFKASDAETLNGISPASLDQSSHVVNLNNPHGVTAAQAGAATITELASLQNQLNAALDAISTLQSNLAATQTELATTQSNLASEIANRIADVDSEQAARLAADATQGTAIAAIQSNSALSLDGVVSVTGGNARGPGDTVLFSGVNLQVVNGIGFTHTINGRGNIIVGYDAADTSDDPICSLGVYDSEADCLANNGTWAISHKNGSHNIVIGDLHSYSRHSGLVAGRDNDITGGQATALGFGNRAAGIYSTVSGGINNVASGSSSSVSGGRENTANESYSSVSGGIENLASGYYASVSGGTLNVASGIQASVSGGTGNDAIGTSSSVSGGALGKASELESSVSGGFRNEASAFYSSVSGGRDNVASGESSSISGGLENDASGLSASISGGQNNAASGNYSSISSGNSNTATSSWSSVSGGQSNDAIGLYSSVSGGLRNIASGSRSSTSGGADRNSTGEADWRAGTLFENF